MAGAQLISRKSGPTLAGISVPGLVAAGVGVATWQRLIARRPALHVGHPSPKARRHGAG
jgi:ubiquinone biosynthesis protein